jgi:NDP-sugar pyrophosphorylase family protein
MKGIILCAGYGTRLRPLTWFTPKCLLKVSGKTILERNIEYLRKNGITEIMINLHYKPNRFIKKIGDMVLYSYEPKLLGEEGTIEHLRDWMNDYTVVMNGDTLTNMNLSKMILMSEGRSVWYMDGKTYAGVRIVPPYNQYTRLYKYYDATAFWVDCGTFKGLRKAREIYAKKTGDLS